MEAFEGYWRKVALGQAPRLPQHARRDHARRRAQGGRRGHRLSAQRAHRRRRSSARRASRLAAAMPPGVSFLDLPEQWDPKSPWHDRRVRLAASHALDRDALNQAETLGLSRPTGGLIPRVLEFALAYRRRPPTIPPRAKKLLAEAGYPERLRRGRPHPVPALLLAGRGGRRAICRPSASARACARWSAPPSSPRGASKKLQGRDHGPRRARRQRGHAHRGLRHQERHLLVGGGARRSRISSSARPASWTARSARRCCTRSSRSCTTG